MYREPEEVGKTRENEEYVLRLDHPDGTIWADYVSETETWYTYLSGRPYGPVVRTRDDQLDNYVDGSDGVEITGYESGDAPNALLDRVERKRAAARGQGRLDDY